MKRHWNKGNQHAKGRGAVQTGKRLPPAYYTVSAKFRDDDPEGRKFKASLAAQHLTFKEFIIRWNTYNEYVQRNILNTQEEHDEENPQESK